MARRLATPEDGARPEPHPQAPEPDAIERLAARMKKHDWTYSFSDDARVFKQGEAAHQLLLSYLKTGAVPADVALGLWLKYAPEDMHPPDFLSPAPPKPAPAKNGRRMLPPPPPADDLADLCGDTSPVAENAKPAKEQGIVDPEPPPLRPAAQAPDTRQSIGRIVTTITAQDPQRLFEELEAAEKLYNPGRSMSVVIQGMEEALANASKASQLAMIAHREARRYKEIQVPELEAALRERARQEMPRKETKDGAAKAPTLQELADWLAMNCSQELGQIKAQQIDLDTFAEHAANLARIWAYRSRDLQEIAASMRATGDGVSGRD